MKKRTIIILLLAFTITLSLNCFVHIINGENFNPEGTTLGTRFYLVGPDSYYNMRTCEQIMETGKYPPVSEGDPLLNYPFADKGARPPLLNMITTEIATITGGTPDTLGWTMLILPCIFGALLVFPLYGIGKAFFNEKIGLLTSMGAFFVPILISEHHGSLLGLFDHDSFLILLLFSSIYFYHKLIKTQGFKSYLYMYLTGATLAFVKFTWVTPIIIFLFFIAYIIIQLLVDVYYKHYDNSIFRKTFLLFFFVFLVTLPYAINPDVDEIYFLPFVVLFFAFIYALYYIFSSYQIKRTIVFSFLGTVSILLLLFLYLINLYQLNIYFLKVVSRVLFSGSYGSKVFSTIGEGQIEGIFQMMMYIGPFVYILGFLGVVFYLFKTIKQDFPKQNLLLLSSVLVCLWLTTQAGRFLYLLAPLLFLFSIYTLLFIKSIDKHQFKIISSLVALAIVLPSSIIIANNIADPYEYKLEKQWSEVSYWISQQDTNLPESLRPAFLGWWDYGFFIATMGNHPVVADNYQSGIPTACSFFTAESEKDVIATLCIRVIEGTIENNTIHPYVKQLINSTNLNPLINIIEQPEKNAPSFGNIITPEYGNTVLTVSAENAVYIDGVSIIATLSTKEVKQFYDKLIYIAGINIGYLVVTERDIEELYPIITYIADKGTWVLTGEDAYYTKDLEKKEKVYNTIVYRIFEGEELQYFNEIYRDNNVVIIKYRG